MKTSWRSSTIHTLSLWDFVVPHVKRVVEKWFQLLKAHWPMANSFLGNILSWNIEWYMLLCVVVNRPYRSGFRCFQVEGANIFWWFFGKTLLWSIEMFSLWGNLWRVVMDSSMDSWTARVESSLYCVYFTICGTLCYNRHLSYQPVQATPGLAWFECELLWMHGWQKLMVLENQNHNILTNTCQGHLWPVFVFKYCCIITLS